MEKYNLACGTTTAELLRLVDWRHGYQVATVAMDATGVYWKPVWHILEGQFELFLANPAQVRALRGRKTDLKGGERRSVPVSFLTRQTPHPNDHEVRNNAPLDPHLGPPEIPA